MATTQTTITFETASGALRGAVQRSIDLVAFGLHAADNADVQELTIPDVSVQVTVDHRRLSPEEARSEFRAWVVGGGIRDCVDAIGPALEWARKELVMWSQPGAVGRKEDGRLNLEVQMPGATWNDDIIGGASAFDRLTLPDKLLRLEALGMGRPAFVDDILSLNAARNCLVHRLGVVGPVDVKSAPDLPFNVTWRRMQLTATGEEGTHEIGPGSVVVAEEQVRIAIVAVEREFALGDHVEFSVEDYSQIALTFQFFSQQVQHEIGLFQESRLSSPDSDEGKGG